MIVMFCYFNSISRPGGWYLINTPPSAVWFNSLVSPRCSPSDLNTRHARSESWLIFRVAWHASPLFGSSYYTDSYHVLDLGEADPRQTLRAYKVICYGATLSFLHFIRWRWWGKWDNGTQHIVHSALPRDVRRGRPMYSYDRTPPSLLPLPEIDRRLTGKG